MHRVFYDVFHHEGARQEFGFSRINGFSDEEGMPGWNLWFTHDAGAHQILLTEALVLGRDEAALPGLRVEGRFVLRYFPHEDDPLLASYSDEEIRLRRGPFFDDTGTLTPGGMQAMGEHLFLAGFLEFRTDLARRYVELSCSAPDRWREVRAQAPDTLCRDAPGWDPVMRLFDRLVSGFCHVHGTTPEAAVQADRRWGRFVVRDDGEPETRPDPGVRLRRMVVGLDLMPPSSGLVFTDLHQRLAEDGFKRIRPVSRGGWWTAKDRVARSGRTYEPEMCSCYQDH